MDGYPGFLQGDGAALAHACTVMVMIAAAFWEVEHIKKLRHTSLQLEVGITFKLHLHSDGASNYYN